MRRWCGRRRRPGSSPRATLREYLRKRGKGVDVVIMSLIPGDL